jgi:SNF2 family DNA or RNA helicase
MHDVTSLDDYLARYGKLLAAQAEQSLRPLHRPGKDKATVAPLSRAPFPAQQHVIAAGAKALKRQRSLVVVGEMGCGKTILGMGIVHTHAKAGYRALIMAPGQLTNKWERELKETIPGCEVFHIDKWTDLIPLCEYGEAVKPTWYILSRDRAKLGAKWRPAYVKRPNEDGLRCPKCGQMLTKQREEGAAQDEDGGLLLTHAQLAKRRQKCPCGEQLWQYTGEIRRWAPATFIHKKLKGFFTYFVADEAHEEKSAESAQGNALGSLAASAEKCLALTGTLIGGYAEHIRPLLMRLAPRSLIQDGHGWKGSMAFSEEYGRIETRITTKEGGSESSSNKQSKGSSSSKSRYIRPGIMPTLFGKHLMQNAVFLGLDEVASNLPSLEEIVQGVTMDCEVASAYAHIDEHLTAAIKNMVRTGDRRLLGAMLQTLLTYPDHPYGWDKVGYWETKGLTEPMFIPVVEPPNLDQKIRPKEEALLDIIEAERKQGRQVWVYTTMTGEKDVADRLLQLAKKRGWRADVLRSTVELKKREEWINKHGPKADVIFSHPKLVETGLDLFDKGGAHNFCTLVFYQTGYNLFTLRQASRRSWRIGQRKPCKVYYLYYEQTMQARAMALMGKKLSAAHAIEGKFSSDGLVAMSGDDGIEMALAKSLADQMDEGSATRAWQKFGTRDMVTGRDMSIEDCAAEIDEVVRMLKELGLAD